MSNIFFFQIFFRSRPCFQAWNWNILRSFDNFTVVLCQIFSFFRYSLEVVHASKPGIEIFWEVLTVSRLFYVNFLFRYSLEVVDASKPKGIYLKQVSCYQPIYKPKSLSNREIVTSCWGSWISSGARSDARWFGAVGIVISRKHFFAFAFSCNSKIINRRVVGAGRSLCGIAVYVDTNTLQGSSWSSR